MLQHKQEATYTRLFRLLKQKAANANISLAIATIHIDFERAVVATVRAEFGIERTCYLFHFSQSVLRHLQQCGLQSSYYDNNLLTVRTWVRRLIVLPLLPPIRIDQAFHVIVAAAPNVPGRDAMNTYVDNTSVSLNGALHQRAALNCYGIQDSTTNACEEYYSIIKSHFR